jgi:hypothetical protein
MTSGKALEAPMTVIVPATLSTGRTPSRFKISSDVTSLLSAVGLSSGASNNKLHPDAIADRSQSAHSFAGIGEAARDSAPARLLAGAGQLL